MEDGGWGSARESRILGWPRANWWGVAGGNHTPRRLRAPNTQAADLQFLPVEPPPAGCLSLQDAGPGVPRVTLSLTLTGTPAFCAALRDAFGIA